MLKRYKSQHIKEYTEAYLPTTFSQWEDLDEDQRGKVLRGLQERGWLTWSFYITISSEELQKYVDIARSLIVFKKDYYDFPVALPSVINAQKRQCQIEVNIALSQIFCHSTDIMFYDFITIYENLALSKAQQPLFIADLENYFQQLGVNMTFSSDQIIPRQSRIIQEKIVSPTLELLKSDEYLQINNEISEGFDSYLKTNYGDFLLCSINALVSTLEYISYGEITKKQRDFSPMVKKLKEKGNFTEKISDLLRAINSYITIERRDKTKAHTSIDKATEQDSLFVFNLVMSVIQFLILSNKS